MRWNMPRKSRAKEIIVEELEKAELSKKKISKIVKDRAKLSEKRWKKTVDKYLYELLREGIIAVVGYDLTVIDDRIGEMVKEGAIIRNVPAEGMIFALIDLGPIPLTSVINSVLNNLKKGNEDYNKLREIFTKKIRELEDEYRREWDVDLKDVSNRKLELNEIIWIEAVYDMQADIQDKPPQIFIKPPNKEIIKYLHKNKEFYNEKFQDILQKYENKRLWYFIDDEPNIQDVDAIKLFVKNQIFDVNEMAEEDYLIKTGLYKSKPVSDTVVEVNEKFEQTMLYINSKPEPEKNNLIYRLAYSLGSDRKSTTRFRNLMEEIQDNTKSYLNEVLDIIERTNKH